MPRTLLVIVDGSPYSAAAQQLAIEWARVHDALVVGLGVIDEPRIRGPEAVPLGAGAFKADRDDSLLAEERRHVEQFLSALALACADAQVGCKLLEDVGTPVEQILLEAQRYDLIVMGLQAFTHDQRELGPSAALRQVLQANPRPVIVVPRQLPPAGPVVVAYDGSLQAARALDAFQHSHLHEGRQVHVLSIQATKVEAARCGDRAVDFLAHHGIAAQRHDVADTTVGPRLLAEAERLAASLLVMGAYGQPKLREFLIGSVTRYVLQHAKTVLFLDH